MSLVCRGCRVTVGNDSALSKHHKTCGPYKTYLQDSIEARNTGPTTSSTVERSTAVKKRGKYPASKKKMTSKLQNRKVRAGSEAARSSPGPSSFSQNFDMDAHIATDDPDVLMQGVDPSYSRSPSPAPLLPSPSPPPALTASGRIKRKLRLPKRFLDLLPEPLCPANVAPPPEVPAPILPRVTLIVRDTFETVANAFGLWRRYPHRPTYDPDSLISVGDLSNQYPPPDPNPEDPLDPADTPPTSTSSNISETLLMNWLNNGNITKSEGELNSLVHDVLQHPDFNIDDLTNFDAGRANKRVDEDAKTAFPLLKDFKETSVDIEVPSGSTDVPPATFSIPGLFYRPLVSIIKGAFADPLSKHFHLTPFTLYHKIKNSAQQIRVFSDLFNSDVFLQEHDHLQRHGKLPPDDPRCKREKIIAALMFWSDSTHLANFGPAKLWPIYMLFGNLSKYMRIRPSIGAEHHVAYIPSLPDSIQDKISQFHAKWATQKGDILTHCRRELMHAVWTLLLDDEFLHAYKYGIVIKCQDGVERRVYPRLFTYSADYPEKVLLATIRDGGLCPCPRCLVPKSELHLMGYVRDIASRVSRARQYLGRKIRAARRFIYEQAFGIGSEKVNGLLKETSSVPTLNAFIESLGDDFNLHRMLVVDFMHEFELGVWKSLFTHLIRLLHAQPEGQKLVDKLNHRYRQMPRFGCDTIRRFATNAADMKKLGARDFEDLLQCAIPAFDGLFSAEHNERVLKLLYRMAEWHSFAKLRMHTDPTIDHLERLTSEIGRLMRGFKNTTCAEFDTFELPREVAARNRREQRAATAQAAAGSGPTPAATAPTAAAPPATKSKKKVTLNLNTYKWHALGDYVSTIRLFGPTDSYSTQLGESLHRLVKRLWAVTNKRAHTLQIAKRYMRLIRARAAARRAAKADTARANKHKHQVGLEHEDPLGFTPAEVHHHTSNARKCPLDMYADFNSRDHDDDPAMVNFIPKLQDHLLGRILNRSFDGDTHEEFSSDDRNTVRIAGNKIYATKTLRVNYTTYDVRRDQDTLNPRTQSFLMVRSPETEVGAHPYWYCQLLGILHATVCLVKPSGSTSPTQMEFLWVRWLGTEPGHRSGIRLGRLPKVGFVPESDPYAFGFLDPAEVIRASHLIPDFAAGRTNELLATRHFTAARAADDTEDWANYHVNIFADRDMLMRYFGGGIGHLDVSSADDLDSDDGMDEDNAEGENEEDLRSEDDGDESEPEADFDDDDEGDSGAGDAGPGERRPEDEDGEDFGPEEDENVRVDSGFADF